MTGELYELRPVGRCRGPACAGVTLLLAQQLWSGISRADRRQFSDVFAQHAGRGLCRRCWTAERRAGCHLDHQARHTPAAWRAEDYAAIRDELPDTTAEARLRAAAERLGCHPDTIRRALRLHSVTP